MKQHPTTLFKERHSQEVHEIVSRPPHWLIRWGATFALGIIVISAAGTWWIHYPDIVTASFTLNSYNIPRKILAQTSGHIEKLLVKNRSFVKAGQPILYLESNINHEQVLKLDVELKRLYNIINNDVYDIIPFTIYHYTDLGELQKDFDSFYLQFNQLRVVLAESDLIRKRKKLINDLNNLRAIEAKLIEIYYLNKSKFKLHRKSTNQSESNTKRFTQQTLLKNTTSLLIQNLGLQNKKKKELQGLDSTNFQYKNIFLKALQNLILNIDTWKHSHVVYTPISGKLSLLATELEKQNITIGKELMIIEPDQQQLYGLIKIPQVNLGKIKEKQKVLIKLDAYPYQEYGIIEGEINKITPIPDKDGTYPAYIDLPKELKTQHNQQLIYRFGLKGTAEIITADRRLAQKLLGIY